MGSIPISTGESVYIHDGTGSADPIAVSAAEGSSVAALVEMRQRFDFVWANAAARTAQTGMVQGSRGFQIDIKTDWVYEGGWRTTRSTTTRTRVGAQNINTTGGALDFDNATSTPAAPDFSYSAGVFTCIMPGTFLITGQFSMQASGIVVGYSARVRKNTTVVQEAADLTSTSGVTGVQLVASVTLVVGDTVDVLWYAGVAPPGAGMDVGAGKTYVTLTRVG